MAGKSGRQAKRSSIDNRRPAFLYFWFVFRSVNGGFRDALPSREVTVQRT